MDRQQINIENALSKGWQLTKTHFSFFLGYLVILLFLSLIFSGLHGGLKSAIVHLAGWLILLLAKLGLYRSALLITDGIKPNFEQLYSNWRHLFSWVISSFFFGLMVFIGLVLLIVPGCFLLAKYGLFPFFLLDKRLGPIEALQAAGKASEGKLWTLFLLFMTCIVINLLGAILLGIGLFVTIPVTLLALATVYRQITQNAILINGP